MKGKIDKDGHLYIERAGKMKPQCCPDQQPIDSFTCGCGDWCPHFREPYEITDVAGIGTGIFVIALMCTSHSISFEDGFTDERGE